MTEPAVTQSPSIAERARGAIWLLPLVIALAEVIAHATSRARVPSEGDFQRAGAYVAAHLRARDQVLAAPAWADPLVRAQLGERLGIARAGALDLEAFDRLWVVAERGHLPASAPTRPPDATRRFGELSVLLYRLGPSPVLYDFVEHVGEARVEIDTAEGPRDCPLVRLGGRGGGLGQGPFWPDERYLCDPQRPWLFVAPTVNEDRDLALRRCLWHHPAGAEPVRAVFADVPLGHRLVVDADIYYEHERNEVHGVVPFELRVRVDGHDVGTLRHFDGDGRKRMVVATQPLDADPRRRGTISFETTTAEPHLRTICWSGSTRTEPREDAP